MPQQAVSRFNPFFEGVLCKISARMRCLFSEKTTSNYSKTQNWLEWHFFWVVRERPMAFKCGVITVQEMSQSGDVAQKTRAHGARELMEAPDAGTPRATQQENSMWLQQACSNALPVARGRCTFNNCLPRTENHMRSGGSQGGNARGQVQKKGTHHAEPGFVVSPCRPLSAKLFVRPLFIRVGLVKVRECGIVAALVVCFQPECLSIGAVCAVLLDQPLSFGTWRFENTSTSVLSQE